MGHYDTWQLTSHFARGRAFYASPLGAMAGHCLARSADSAGRRIPRTPWWSYLPQGDRERGVPPQRGIMYVHETPNPLAGSYEIDGSMMVETGRTARRLLRLARLSPRSHEVLSVYHGDRGAMWATLSNDRRDSDGNLHRGTGPGALAALYVMTEAGQALLRFERELSQAPVKETKKIGKKRVEVLAAHAAYREELRAAIARKQAEHLGLEADRDRAAEALGDARVGEILGQEEGKGGRATMALRQKVKEATAELEAVNDHRARLLREVFQLQHQLAYTAVPGAANRLPEEGYTIVLRQRRAAQEVHAAAVAAWESTKADLERVCGPMPDDDPRLPPRPTPPDLPAVPQTRSVMLPQGRRTGPLPPPAQTDERGVLSDDDRLGVAFTLAATGGRDTSDAGQKNKLRRALLLQRASAQATLLLNRAWEDWKKAGNSEEFVPRSKGRL